MAASWGKNDLAHGEDPPDGFSVMASSFGFDIRSGREAIDIEKLSRIDLESLLKIDRTSVSFSFLNISSTLVYDYIYMCLK